MLELAFASAIAFAAPAAIVRQPKIELSAFQMLAWGKAAELKGDRATAVHVYRSLEQDGDADIRSEARFRLAALLVAEGKNSTAAALLRKVLDDRPNATPVRLALAQLLATMGDETAARRELRALQSGQLPLEVARLVDRFSEALRVRKPFGASLELAIAPDSNINRATRSDTVGTVIGPFDISEEGKATSGIGTAVRGQIYRRIDLTRTAGLLARVSAAADIYRDGDFTELSLDAAVGPELRLGRNHLRLEAGAGRRWFGGEPFVDSARLAASLTRPIGRRTQLRITGSAALIDNRQNDLQDGKAYGFNFGVERALSSSTGLALSLAGDRLSATDPAYSTRSWRTSVIGWREVGRVTLTAGLDYGRLTADERLALLPDKRRETFSRVSLGATFRQLQISGFAPLVRYSIERNRSSIEIYDYSRRRAEFGIARAF